MGRPSTLPTFATVEEGHAAILDPAVTMPRVMTTHDGERVEADIPVGLTPRTKSGSEYGALLGRFHAADSRCVVCDLPTLLTRWDGPATATLGHLIAPSLILDVHADDVQHIRDTYRTTADTLRVGYVPTNLATFCRACIDASVAYSAVTGEAVVWGTGLAGLDRVAVQWPTLSKSATRPTMPTGDEFRAIAQASLDHDAHAARARASQGLPF